MGLEQALTSFIRSAIAGENHDFLMILSERLVWRLPATVRDHNGPAVHLVAWHH